MSGKLTTREAIASKKHYLISDPVLPNFSLHAGISSILAQLHLSCGKEGNYRALNLDIVCPEHLPIVTACTCLAKNREGKLVNKTHGDLTNKVENINNILITMIPSTTGWLHMRHNPHPLLQD